MLDALSLTFMQNALAAAVLASIACGIVGSLVVVNRMVFLAGGVAHSAYGGVGLAFALGLPVLPTTLGFTLAASGLMAGATLNRSEETEALTGALWAGGMALGILLLDATPGYNVDLVSYLFGSILAVGRFDLALMALLTLALSLVSAYFYRDLLATSYDPDFARTRGVPVTAIHYLLIAMVAVSVVLVIQVVGLILVIALMTMPPRMAARRTASLAAMMGLAALLSSVFCLAGLWLAYSLDLTSGAAIIAVTTLAFCADGLWLRFTRG